MRADSVLSWGCVRWSEESGSGLSAASGEATGSVRGTGGTSVVLDSRGASHL